MTPPAASRRTLTRPVPPARQYSLLGLFGLFVLLLAVALLLYLVYPAILDWGGYWSDVPQCAAVVAVAFALRPEYLAASRWRAPVRAVAAGVATLYLLQSAFIRWDPAAERQMHVTPLPLVMLVILVPVLEELFFRSLLLRGAIYRLGVIWGIVVVDAAWAWAHPVHWIAGIQGLILCLVYLWAEDSVGASALCHASMNAVVLFPQWSLFLLLRR